MNLLYHQAVTKGRKKLQLIISRTFWFLLNWLILFIEILMCYRSIFTNMYRLFAEFEVCDKLCGLMNSHEKQVPR